MRRAAVVASVLLVAACARARPETRAAWRAVYRDCRAGDVQACAWQGREEVRDDDCAAALKHLEPACDARVGLACTGLGHCYASGASVAKDLARAAALYRTACDLGDGEGCNSLGNALSRGAGIAANAVEAAQLFARACTLGDDLGCSNYAWALSEGSGVAKDVASARARWRSLCPRLDTACRKLADSMGEEDPHQAAVIAEEGCAANGRASCEAAGYFLQKVKRPVEAIRYLREACRRGDRDGCYWLARVLDTQATAESAEVERLYTDVCKHQQRACYSQALMHLERRGDSEAVRQELAALCRRGSRDACAWLCGAGAAAEPEPATSWCEAACTLGHQSSCQPAPKPAHRAPLAPARP